MGQGDDGRHLQGAVVLPRDLAAVDVGCFPAGPALPVGAGGHQLPEPVVGGAADPAGEAADGLPSGEDGEQPAGEPQVWRNGGRPARPDRRAPVVVPVGRPGPAGAGRAGTGGRW
ncbi:hypothetical protein C8250_018670 [Streptomyces sp. So13.3]|uniref:hypothetical protein n=1 Tax=Streptomyces sp. So13.3 TaxID=2136173 RepID=UPI00164EA3DC|nr:hypothetical protein [Streptomyces sp. So13.3]QNA73671.1 hypothetical protein C8250_018670 [Streptomyces sp. So13.3]